jgi:glutathione S-transferase
MPTYKLTYFNLRGKAEYIRLLFAAAGVDYEDHRIDRQTDWPGTIKDSTPFGQLPILTIDGKTFSQTLPVGRYIADKYGLSGHTELDKLRSDMIVHCVEDILTAVVKVRFTEDPETKAKFQKNLTENQLPAFFRHLEKLLIENNGGNGFYVGDSLGSADIAVFNCLNHLVPMANLDPPFNCSEYPKLQALSDRVKANPKIAAWIAKRPETPF